MLSFAYENLLKANEYASLKSEEFENIYDLMSEIVYISVSHLIKKGIYKEYTLKSDTLSTVRGKINISTTVKDLSLIRHQLVCEYDEFNENILYNQIIKTTINHLISNKDLPIKSKKKLKKVVLYFNKVDTVNLNQVQWKNIRFHKNNSTYIFLIEICKFIYEGLLISTDSGKIRYKKFIDDQRMHHLYEKFILGYYQRYYPDLNPNASIIDWNAQIIKGQELLPIMHSDITLYSKTSKKTLVIDAKYYGHSLSTHHEKISLHSGNLYQIFTYVKNKDVDHLGNVSGLLLYAKTDETIAPDCEYVMDGSKIGARTLDLNQDFKNIAAILDHIVFSHFSQSN